MANIIDDGSLACLHIPRDEKNRSFNCDETTQSKLVNTQFWVVDFIEDVPPVSPMIFKQGIAPWLGWAAHSNSKNLVKLFIPKEYVSIL